MTVTLYHGDCLTEMDKIETGSVDAIIADWPYGTTACKWDTVIPFEPLWKQCKRVIKSKGAIVLFGGQPFTSALVMSNVGWFKWETIWRKTRSTGHLNCRVMPLRQHENLIVFGKGSITYNPQLTQKPQKDIRSTRRSKEGGTDCYGAYDHDPPTTIPLDMSYPRSVVTFNNVNGKERGLHPTQKPVALLEYLIRTYTDEGETVLDNTMGSGTTGVACVNTGRSFIGIELDRGYFDIAQRRIAHAQNEMCQLELEVSP